MAAYKDKRRFDRRSKTMRFRFQANGTEHRAVCTNLSAGGAFLKASHVPMKGDTVTLREVFRGNRDVGLRVVGEVVWTIAKPTLETPETGYALQFNEAWAEGDKTPLIDFVSIFQVPEEDDLRQETRGDKVVTVYRFPDTPAPEPAGAAMGPSTYDALPEVDLASELDRLDRQQRRRGQPAAGPQPNVRASSESSQTDRPVDKRALSYYTRGRPPKKRVPKRTPGAPEGSQARQLPTGGPDKSGAMPLPGRDLAADSQEISRQEAAAGPRKRRFGGLLGLFGFGDKEDGEMTESGVETGFEGEQSYSATFEESDSEVYFRGEDDLYVTDDDPGEVIVEWKNKESGGHIEKISTTMVAVNTPEEVPAHYERVSITPNYPSFKSPTLVMHGTVTRIQDRGNGTQTVLVRFSKLDERGRPGAFQEFLKLVRRG